MPNTSRRRRAPARGGCTGRVSGDNSRVPNLSLGCRDGPLEPHIARMRAPNRWSVPRISPRPAARTERSGSMAGKGVGNSEVRWVRGTAGGMVSPSPAKIRSAHAPRRRAHGRTVGPGGALGMGNRPKSGRICVAGRATGKCSVIYNAARYSLITSTTACCIHGIIKAISSVPADRSGL